MITINQLQKKFGDKTAVDIENYTIAPGTMLGLVGNNGAGKTTLFRLILDLLQADRGNVTVDGGAKVTVYGKNFSTIASDGKACGVNGIHISDTAKSSILTVSGTGTELSILYDSDRLPVDGNNNSMTPAAVNVSVKVDGAKFTIGSTEGSISWGYAVWFDYLDYQQTIEATNGAQVTADIVPGSNGQIFGNCEGIYATEGTSASGEKTSMTMPMKRLPSTARWTRPEASTMPAARLQNRKAISIGSLTAVRKRTIESAPTMPSERTTLLVTASITKVVTSATAMSEVPKFAEYMTPR